MIELRKPTAAPAVALSLLGIASTAPAMAADIITPSGILSNNGVNSALNNSNRTYQMQFAASTLGGLSVGDLITGISFRLASNVTVSNSPASNFANWDLTLAQAANSVSAMSSTFASNMVAPTLVRSGSLSFAAGDFQGGAINPTTNPWGPVIGFTTPYTYQGGDLVVLISHTPGSASVGFFDALSSSAAGYGTDYKAFSSTRYNGTSGIDQPVTITKFTSQPGSSAVPEPGEWAAMGILGAGLTGLVIRKRRKV